VRTNHPLDRDERLLRVGASSRLGSRGRDAELARRELSLMGDAVGGTRERIARDSERLAELLN
jgi:hypothetical protein